MKKDYYTDVIMGEWEYDKKSSTKEHLSYKRRKALKLHNDYAIDWTDPVDYRPYRVYGDVVLTENKLINIKTSKDSFFRGLELTATSIKIPMS